jgi:hypothetical protein
MSSGRPTLKRLWFSRERALAMALAAIIAALTVAGFLILR